MVLSLLMALPINLASPFVTFNQVDVPGSAMYCYLESASYNSQLTLIVDASSCIRDQIFSDGFDKLATNVPIPPQNRNQP